MSVSCIEELGGLKYLVVGSGLYGSVIAERIASQLNEKVLVIDKRGNTGGNAHARIDEKTGIELHTFGSHIFHTKNKRVWDYLNRFTSFNSYRHRVFISHQGETYPMPIGLQTINQFFRKNFRPFEAEQFVNSQIDRARYANPANLEEKAISLIGEPLYRAFIEGYTKKQWNRSPRELPAGIITRLPVRFSYNSEYFTDPWQGIPAQGYGHLFDSLLAHPNITVQTGVSYHDIKHMIPCGCKIVYTGMPDELLDYRFGELEWRSLEFEWETQNVMDYQGNSVINYADPGVSYTRIHEFKHYHPEWDAAFHCPQTIICKEYPAQYRRGGEAFYPVENAENTERYGLYAREAAKNQHLILGGRLGCYKYWDMDKTVENALTAFERHLQSHS